MDIEQTVFFPKPRHIFIVVATRFSYMAHVNIHKSSMPRFLQYKLFSKNKVCMGCKNCGPKCLSALEMGIQKTETKCNNFVEINFLRLQFRKLRYKAYVWKNPYIKEDLDRNRVTKVAGGSTLDQSKEKDISKMDKTYSSKVHLYTRLM